MFSKTDIQQMREMGITPADVEQQIENFKQGFKPLDIVKPATLKDGIRQLTDNKLNDLINRYEKMGSKLEKVKFVPASGAASRMFKSLFEAINTYTGDEKSYLDLMGNRQFGSIYYFCNNLQMLAFYDDLNQSIHNNGSSIEKLSSEYNIVFLLKCLLTECGLNYGNLPKGLLKFHRTATGNRTPVEEHMVEGALYATSGKKVNLHFTVSPEHINLFKKHITEVKTYYEKKFNIKYNITLSVQKSSTDTIAVDANNNPIKNQNGQLIFRPGGHGALIKNLSELKADIIFIKNIDNVTQDRHKHDTVNYKKALAGWLLSLRQKTEKYYKLLTKDTTDELINETEQFLRKNLTIIPPDSFYTLKREQKIAYLKSKLNRPIRVCGMVRNQGEPGGGPYWVKSADGSVELQIVESSQFTDQNKHLMQKATHFNPVDVVCCIKDFKGKKYKLDNFIDKNTGFISSKSAEGRELKALELPGLWNGAMSNWTTVFAEVPISTFTPVKTVHDLLRTEHLYENDLLNDSRNKTNIL